MNKISSLLLILNLSGFTTLANAACHYTNKELQNLCAKIEQDQREARQTLQDIYDKAAPKNLSSINSIPPVNKIMTNPPTNTTYPNTPISSQANQFNIFSNGDNKKTIFK